MTAASFRLVSWNIRKAIGRDLRRNPDRVLDAIGNLGADVVVLQEADLRFRGRGALFDPNDIVARTGLRHIRFPDAHAGLGWHGNVLLVREGLNVPHRRIIPLPSLEPRGAIAADIEIEGTLVHVVGAHLALLGAVRRSQSRALARTLPAGRPAIVAGDFNVWPGAIWSLSALTRGLTEVPTGASFPASRPVVALDRIFATTGLSIVASDVDRSEGAARASDHLPIWADVTLQRA